MTTRKKLNERHVPVERRSTMTPKQKRVEIKRLLSLLNDHNREVFNRMYSPHNITQDVNITVDSLETKKLSWALQQCQNTYYKLFRVLKNA